MMPQVNLLNGLDQQNTPIRASIWVSMLLLGIALIGFGTLIQGNWVANKQAQLAAESQKKTRLLAQVDALERTSPNHQKEREILADIARLKTDIQTQKTTLALVAPEAEIQRKGFSDYLAALSDRRRQGLWLTDITLDPGKHRARLIGQTLDPALVPLYLDSLKDTAFSEIQFGRMDMKKIGDNPTLYQFDLDGTNTGTIDLPAGVTPTQGFRTVRVSP